MTYEFAKEYSLLIGGQWVPAEGGETFETTNPATGEVLARCADASADDVQKAVDAARAAFPAWAAKSALPRKKNAAMTRTGAKIRTEKTNPSFK